MLRPQTHANAPFKTSSIFLFEENFEELNFMCTKGSEPQQQTSNDQKLDAEHREGESASASERERSMMWVVNFPIF